MWKALENKAAAAYIDSRKEEYVDRSSRTPEARFDKQFSDVTRPSFASKMNAALKVAREIDFSSCPEEEPDDWLNVDAENFDSSLQNMAPGQSTGIETMDVDQKEEQLAQEQASKLKSLAQKVEEFVEGEGDFEGALVEEYVDWIDNIPPIANRMTSDDADGSDFSEGMSDSDDESNPEAVTDDDDDDAAKSRLVPGLEPGEYGKMPPLFYANSQKVAPNSEHEEEPPSEPTIDENDEPPPIRRPIRPPILPRDKFDGVDSDDETDEDELAVGNDEDTDEDHPELVGDIEPDMDEEEEEFLDFSRRVLGISNEQWNDIINERKNRGGSVFCRFLDSRADFRRSIYTFHSNPVGVETAIETCFQPSSAELEDKCLVNGGQRLRCGPNLYA